MTNTFKAHYVGEAEGDVEAFGVTFEEGKSADVPERFRAKVEDNPFFEIGGAKSDKSEPKAKSSEPPNTNQAPTTTVPEGPYEAKEKSPGWYAIYGKDGKEIGKAIRKDDADAFTAMSDDDKAAYVKSEVEAQ